MRTRQKNTPLPAAMAIGALAVATCAVTAVMAAPAEAATATVRSAAVTATGCPPFDLGTLPGGTMSEARDINAFDVSVGVSNATQSPQFFRAARWSPSGRVTDLGTLPGGNASTARSIDAVGFVAGDSNAGSAAGLTSSRAVYWDPFGHIHRLTVPAGTISSSATQVSETALFIGRADSSTRSVALRWNVLGGATTLADLPGTAGSVPVALNNGGVVVGSSVVGPTKATGAALRWDIFGRALRLDAIPGSVSSVADAINQPGVAVGTATIVGGLTRAVRWDPQGHVRNLGTLPGGDRSSAVGINDTGTVIGASNSVPDGPLHAVMWDRFGQVHALASLGAGTTVVDINNRGYMTGYVQPADAVLPVAALWSPSGALTRLGVIAGGDEDGIGVAIAPDNTVAGYASNPNEDNHAVLWKPSACRG